MADQRLSANMATANRVETVPCCSWGRKRSLHSRMQAVRADKVRNRAQATGVNQASSEDTASQQQPLEQVASEPQQPELSHTPPPAFPHQGQAHTDIPAIETDDQQPGPSTQSTSAQRNNDDELLLSHGQHFESTSDDEVHQLYTIMHAFLTYILAQKPKCHKICLLQYTADSDSSEDEFELTTKEAAAVLDSWVVDMDRHQQRKVIILMTHHLINTVGMNKTDAYKQVAARFCISDRSVRKM